MIRYSEMVLPGHPDKFCDQAAEAIVQACHAIDEDAYCQVEMSVWCGKVFLTGGLCTREPLPKRPADIVCDTAKKIGYRAGGPNDPDALEITSVICEEVGDPSRWTSHVNDQCIATGWAGYDDKVDFLPPEHWLARRFHDALVESCKSGVLEGCGPDGKLLVRLRESSDEWVVEHLLVTLQHPEETSIEQLTGGIDQTIGKCYSKLQTGDQRWSGDWRDVELLVNPNGPWHDGGSFDDNGQTGRKLVMDYYGPRVPIGGGAIYGKHPQHIDRVAARELREEAVRRVKAGESECLLQGSWAPGVEKALDITQAVNSAADSA